MRGPKKRVAEQPWKPIWKERGTGNCSATTISASEPFELSGRAKAPMQKTKTSTTRPDNFIVRWNCRHVVGPGKRADNVDQRRRTNAKPRTPTCPDSSHHNRGSRCGRDPDHVGVKSGPIPEYIPSHSSPTPPETPGSRRRNEG